MHDIQRADPDRIEYEKSRRDEVTSKKELRRAQLSRGQRALLELLRKSSGKRVSTEQILNATSWKSVTWQVYLNNGLFSPYLSDAGNGRFDVRLPDDLTEWEFYRQVSQSSEQRHIAAPCKRALARALVEKSRDNMILALELYNRPSLENRLDAFSILFCTAWEQILKAEMVELRGESSIFKKKKAGRRRETISLQSCLESQFSAGDLVRRNVERIAELRHGATHLLMPALQGPLSRLFQAGVLNYAQRYSSLAAVPLLPRSASGLLSMVAEDEDLEAADLKKLYGSIVADDLERVSIQLRDEIDQVADQRFAVKVEYRLALTKNEGEGDILLTSSRAATQGGLIVVKPRLVDETHPYRQTEVLQEVSKQLGTDFSQYDFQAVLHKEKWRNSNNEFHFLQKRPDTPKYSSKAIETICSSVQADDGYLERARSAYKGELSRRRRGSK